MFTIIGLLLDLLCLLILGVILFPIILVISLSVDLFNWIRGNKNEK